MPGHGTGLYGEGSPALQGEWAELTGMLASSFPDLQRNLVPSHGKQPRGATTFSTRFFPTGTLSLSVKIFTSLS